MYICQIIRPQLQLHYLSKMSDNNQLTKASDNLPASVSLTAQLNLADRIAKSGMTPYRTKEAVLSIMLYGKELGLGIMTSLNNMHFIDGKVGLGVHLITGKLLGGGVTYDCIEDYVRVYRYMDIESRETISQQELDKLDSSTYKIVGFSGDNAARVKQKEEYLNKYQGLRILAKDESFVDYRTTILFKRVMQLGNETIVKEHRETLYQSQVPDSFFKKANWKNHTPLMLRNRPLVTGARFFASDLINGLYDTTELLDNSDIDYKTDESGNVTYMGNAPVSNINPEAMESIIEEATSVEVEDTVVETEENNSAVTDLTETK